MGCIMGKPPKNQSISLPTSSRVRPLTSLLFPNMSHSGTSAVGYLHAGWCAPEEGRWLRLLGLWKDPLLSEPLTVPSASLPTRTDMIAWCVFTPKIKPARQLGAPLSFPMGRHLTCEMWDRSTKDLLSLPSTFFTPSVKVDQNSFGILLTWTLI